MCRRHHNKGCLHAGRFYFNGMTIMLYAAPTLPFCSKAPAAVTLDDTVAVVAMEGYQGFFGAMASLTLNLK